jgi:hypothetical protein
MDLPCSTYGVIMELSVSFALVDWKHHHSHSLILPGIREDRVFSGQHHMLASLYDHSGLRFVAIAVLIMTPQRQNLNK